MQFRHEAQFASYSSHSTEDRAVLDQNIMSGQMLFICRCLTPGRDSDSSNTKSRTRNDAP